MTAADGGLTGLPWHMGSPSERMYDVGAEAPVAEGGRSMGDMGAETPVADMMNREAEKRRGCSAFGWNKIHDLRPL